MEPEDYAIPYKHVPATSKLLVVVFLNQLLVAVGGREKKWRDADFFAPKRHLDLTAPAW